MRVDVKKFLFIGPKVDKELFFSKAQHAGLVEFINPEGKKQVRATKEVEDFAKAIKTLRGFVQEEQEIKRDLTLAKKVTAAVLDAKHSIGKAEDELRKLSQMIALVLPFGNFSLEEISSIEKGTNRKFRFYCGKSAKHLTHIDENLILINFQDGLDYFVAITEDPIQHRDLVEVHIPQSLRELRKSKSELNNTISHNEAILKSLTRYNWLLHYALVEELNHQSFHFATESANTLLDDNLFVIEGWVPDNKKNDVLALTSSLNIFSEEVAIEKNQSIPTYLENKGIPKVGEDVIHIFDVPSTHDKDPSVWVLAAFSLFFAMIVGDAGYGLIFLIAALVMRFKIKNLKGLASRLVKLVTILAVSCILWGAAMNSFFAISFSPTSFLRSNSLITWLINSKADYHLKAHDDVYDYWAKQYPNIANAQDGKEFVEAAQLPDGSNAIVEKFTSNITLELALFIGSIHIILGMLRYVRKIPTGAGWVLFIIGCYLYFPYYLDSTSIIHFIFGVPKTSGAMFGLQLLFGGVGLAVLIALIKGGFAGIFECMAAIQIFADVMSYLRIFALGYAGSIVATQINEMAAHMPLAIAIVVIALSHVGNIVLSIMGGVIHGLRLNFLEWYRYSFEGGGKKFKPLELHVFE